jgi:hypothetical protein
MPQEVRDIFEFDPFQQAAPAGAEPAAAPASADNQPTPAAPTQAPQAAPGPDLTGLQAQVAVITDHLLRAPAAAPSPQAAPPEVPLPTHGYAFTIPDALVAAMASDNPAERGQAIGALVQGTARNIHSEVVRHMRGEIMRAVPQLIQRAIAESSTQQAVANDFYGTYPEFNRPEIKQLVGTIAPQVAQRMGIQGWTPALRDAVAQEVRNLLASVSGQVPQAQPQTPMPQAPTLLNGGARPAAAPVNDVIDTLFG